MSLTSTKKILGFERNLGFLTAAVVVGGVGSALALPLLLDWFQADTARNLALALATTLTAATHARLVHGQPFRSLLPTLAVSAPLVYLAMRAVHLLLRL